MTFEQETEHSNSHWPELAGHAVFDSHFRRVGIVTDVLYDERRQTPRWVVVKTGPVRGEHFVPLAASYVDQDGRLVMPHLKESIKHAPRARRDHVVTSDVDRELRDYWSIAA
jgi:hypothetical protein